MDFIANLTLGFQTALLPINVLYCFIGALLGTLIGVLPGIGPATTIAMLLPLTFSLSPTSSLIMLAGIFYGAQYGGSTTAILINLPGETSSAVTAIDGYKMAQQGRAGPALSIAAIGSFFAGTVATLVIAVMAPALVSVALKFGAPEYFSLMVLGLISSVALARGSILKAVAMIVLGLLLGTVGTDLYTGSPRGTFGFRELSDGLDFVAIAVGLFGIAEILRNLETGSQQKSFVRDIGRLLPSRADLSASYMPILRGTLLGSLLGILPGGGALLSTFASYALEKKISKHPERFGQGAIEGVAGPESANNAAAQTSFIPMLSLGLPANAVMALMAGALILHGIVPGPEVASAKPDLFWGLIVSMWVGNLMLIVLNLPLVGVWVRLLSIPYSVLVPAIMVFCTIGIYSTSANVFDLYTLTFFGLLGYLFTRLDCEPAPLLLGFIIGPLLEEYLRRSMILSEGNPLIFVSRPISAVLMALVAFVLLAAVIPSIAKKREEVFADET